MAPPLLGNTIGAVTDGLVVAEWQDAGGPTEERCLIAPVHVHYRDDEVWYVLEGTLRIQVGDGEVEARAGSGASASRDATHIGIRVLDAFAICGHDLEYLPPDSGDTRDF